MDLGKRNLYRFFGPSNCATSNKTCKSNTNCNMQIGQSGETFPRHIPKMSNCWVKITADGLGFRFLSS